MKSISTGFGLAILGGCILGAAVVASPRLGHNAFAQGTGGDRRIVSTSVFPMTVAGLPGGQTLVSQRTWSDNAIDVRILGQPNTYGTGNQLSDQWQTANGYTSYGSCPWRTLDNGTSGFRPLTDVDMSGDVDAGDISTVLLDFNSRSDDFPPPPIDCTINAPR